MKNKDIRWIQRFSNYEYALNNLKNAIEISKKRELSDLEKQGLIQSFEYTFELCWNVIKDYFYYQGNPDIKGSREAIKEAFKYGIIDDGKLWLEMIETRNLTVHSYDKKTAEEVLKRIIEKYYELFEKFYKKMLELKSRE